MNFRRIAIDAVSGVLHTAGVFRSIHRRVLPESVSIVMYHGLIDTPLPVPDWCFLPLDRFERHMKYLARYFEVVHLEDAFEPGRRRSSKPLACVTFDDGFACVHDLALPVLERFQIPATVYLVTDLVDSDRTVWFTELHRAICQTSASDVRLNGRHFPLVRLADRAESSISMQRALQALAQPDFAETLEDVMSQLGLPEPRSCPPRDAFRTLTGEEIRHMSRNDLVRFGAHTASHQILTRTTREHAQREIQSSVAAVAGLVERPSRSFAYPGGGADDFDRDTIEEVKRAGIDYAVSTFTGPNGPATDRYVIRRYGIGSDYGLPRFAELAHHTRHAVRKVLGKSARNLIPVSAEAEEPAMVNDPKSGLRYRQAGPARPVALPKRPTVGIVVIGRNEGCLLERSLRAAIELGCPIVYVDSGSSDGSTETARAIGPDIWVEELDPSSPFTAARGRNHGFSLLTERMPGLEYVQFVDGDSVLSSDWLCSGVSYLEEHPDVAIAAGQLLEERRDRNIYHRLAAMEWSVPTGEVESTGGINLVRANAYRAAGGYDGGIKTGEEFEMCLRVAAQGYRIVRLPDLMARHDCDMDHFSEWWQRCVRNGQGFSEGAYGLGLRHPEGVKQVASILTWTLGVPAAALTLAVPTSGLSLGLLVAYPVLYARIRRARLQLGDSPKDARLYASAILLGKFANLVGVGQFLRRWQRKELSHGRQCVRQGALLSGPKNES